MAACGLLCLSVVVFIQHTLHSHARVNLISSSKGQRFIPKGRKISPWGRNPSHGTDVYQPTGGATAPAPGQPLFDCSAAQEANNKTLPSRPRNARFAFEGDSKTNPDNDAQINFQASIRDICKNPKIRGLLEVELVPGYESQYEHWYDADGWVDEAFINYFANKGKGGEKYIKQTELLIESVHRFSKRPIVSINFGLPAPDHWKKKEHLILLQAQPLPEGESFNYNKFRAMILARVRTGIELDSDQLVATGIDRMFTRTAEEVTKAYPYPILPVHWMSKDDDPAYPNRPYKDYDYRCPNCPTRTMRWGHAHPTWTHEALPFIGNLLDKYLEKKMLGRIQAGTISEDEDALNVGLWTVQATKEWCKFDIPSPDLFANFISQDADGLRKGAVNGALYADPKWYPQGIPLVFYTAHDTKDPVKTFKLLEQLTQPDARMENPIYYNGTFYADQPAFKAAHPEVRCLI